MKKIGIISLFGFHNYGCLLQCFALQTILKSLGHTPTHIVFTDEKIKNKPLFKRVRTFLGKIRNSFKTKELKKFADNFIEYRNVKTEEATSIAKDYDAFIVGSDQIWRPRFVTFGIQNAFCSFAAPESKPCISYAASFGSEEWEYSEQQTKECAQLAKQFKAISVREASAVQLCKEHLGVEATHILDPTLLLTSNDYKKIIPQKLLSTKAKTNKKKVFAFFLDQTKEKETLVDTFLQENDYTQLSSYLVNSEKLVLRSFRKYSLYPAVETWLSNFANADFVITDSFHACVFSIIFRKPFICYANVARGNARIPSLLSMLGIAPTHLISSLSELQPASTYALPSDIDETLTSLRQFSINWLSSNLQD